MATGGRGDGGEKVKRGGSGESAGEKGLVRPMGVAGERRKGRTPLVGWLRA